MPLSIDSSAPVRPARSRLGRTTAFVAAGVAVAALALAAPIAASALPAAPSVTLNENTASSGGYVTVTVADFQPNEAVAVTFDSTPMDNYVEAGTQGETSSTGGYVTDAYIPGTPALGTHDITVTGATTGPVSAQITIVASPTASMSATSIPLSTYQSTGATVTFTGFPAGATIDTGIGSTSSGTGTGSVTADSSGVATVTYVPTAGDGFDTVGSYVITASTDAGNIVARAAFTVTANAVVAPAAPAADPAAAVRRAATFTG
jgi:hypothetical protein